ncbi:MAG: bifunctional 2-polyprenyl-6-hydroxyphenol methylase/3-demethylubiquinol 3-O-methyltransferase UbiG [Betaproteobacteria bacterium]|nr:bifunctional 2-polyprenyl-6-hydroxyphenol methylase/3-demethylubiquinol 3-O-methyltransferase UbiG [Betaproteobacteria bacterium]
MQTNQLNVDPAELAKFGALAARWWDPNSEFKPLHEINPLRLNHIDQRVQLKDKRVIDVGCGGGILAESMAVRGANVTGIDLSEKPLSVAKLHLLESGQKVDYQLISAEDMAAAQPASFDCVTCMEMLEHVPNPQSTVRACADMVKPGGWVFFSTLNRNPKSFLFAIVGAEYILNLLPKGTHEYRRFITPSELSAMARKSGLSVTEFTGMTYNPLSKHYALGDDISVNYIVACRKPA